MIINRFNKSGFTLIETVLYLTLCAIFMLSITMFALTIIDNTKLSDSFNETQTGSNFAFDQIVNQVQKASSVVDGLSVFDNDNGVLMLQVDGVQVKFYLNNGDIYMKIGSAADVKLNSDNITVSKLRFHKITAHKTPTQIVIDSLFTSRGSDINTINTTPVHTAVSLRTI